MYYFFSLYESKKKGNLLPKKKKTEKIYTYMNMNIIYMLPYYYRIIIEDQATFFAL